MPHKKQKLLRRGAICGSLLIWLAVQFTQLLKPVGLPVFKSGSLVVAGLIALPVLVLWPWLKEALFEVADEKPAHPLTDDQHQSLVTCEILALSALLLFLLMYVP